MGEDSKGKRKKEKISGVARAASSATQRERCRRRRTGGNERPVKLSPRDFILAGGFLERVPEAQPG
jgi:hypothetical protein